MSNMSYSWWGFVRNMIRRYEIRKRRGLSDGEQREQDAVKAAKKAILNTKDGADILRLMDAVYWRKNKKTLQGAAMELYISYATARRWNYEFFIAVAGEYGLLDKKA